MLAIDPLLFGDLTWTPLLLVVAKVLVIFVVGLVGTMFMVWFERKIIAGMQNRVGPNKAGPFGILQTLADGMKLIFKEDFMPDRADRIVYRLAPFLAFVPAFLVWSVIPLGGDFRDGNDGIVVWFGEPTRVQLADPPVGILLVLALSSLAVYGIMLAGWSSGSKYPLLGAGAGERPDGQLRGRPRAQPGGGAALGRDALDRRHRHRPGHPVELEPRRHRRRAVRRSSSSPPPPSSTARRSTSSRPSRSWSAGSTPSTPRSASPCSSSPSS